MPERRHLDSQLVRAQAMLWSAEDPSTKARIQRFIRDIEPRLLALDDHATAPTAVTPRSMARLSK